MTSVETAFAELLKKKLSRVARLALPERPRGVGLARGLFVFFTDFGRAFVSREAWCHGQLRMADDDLAPSRSYLKVEEAFVSPWLERNWCRWFVINLKFGRVDPVALLAALRGADSPFVRARTEFAIRHLYHDREEFTVVGELGT